MSTTNCSSPFFKFTSFIVAYWRSTKYADAVGVIAGVGAAVINKRLRNDKQTIIALVFNRAKLNYESMTKLFEKSTCLLEVEVGSS